MTQGQCKSIEKGSTSPYRRCCYPLFPYYIIFFTCSNIIYVEKKGAVRGFGRRPGADTPRTPAQPISARACRPRIPRVPARSGGPRRARGERGYLAHLRKPNCKGIVKFLQFVLRTPSVCTETLKFAIIASTVVPIRSPCFTIGFTIATRLQSRLQNPRGGVGRLGRPGAPWVSWASWRPG